MNARIFAATLSAMPRTCIASYWRWTTTNRARGESVRLQKCISMGTSPLWHLRHEAMGYAAIDRHDLLSPILTTRHPPLPLPPRHRIPKLLGTLLQQCTSAAVNNSQVEDNGTHLVHQSHIIIGSLTLPILAPLRQSNRVFESTRNSRFAVPLPPLVTGDRGT